MSAPLSWSTAQILFDMGLACLLGFVVGFERRWRSHEGALHANMLVCLGSAIFILASVTLDGGGSVGRALAQITTGIGFLGAGAIIRDGWRVRGLGTAATFWCTAAIGCLCGLGLRIEAVFACLFVIGVNVFVHWLNGKIDWPKTPDRPTD